MDERAWRRYTKRLAIYFVLETPTALEEPVVLILACLGLETITFPRPLVELIALSAVVASLATALEVK